MDLDRGGHARHEHHALRNRFELDAQGDALRQAHPREDRVRRRDALIVRLRVRDPGAAMVLDVQLPGLRGLDLQQELAKAPGCNTTCRSRISLGRARDHTAVHGSQRAIGG